MRPYLEKSYHKKIGLVEWLKGKALNSKPSRTTTTRKKAQEKGPRKERDFSRSQDSFVYLLLHGHICI
jgi:hypothetical protein